VSTENHEYDSLSMGRGELGAMYLVWRLSRLEAGTIVLLEEPESHLAVYSQERLVYVLARLIVQYDLTAVCASHTPSLLTILPGEGAVVVRSVPRPEIDATLDAREVARQLGVPPERSITCVAEDICGGLLLRELVNYLDMDLGRHLAVVHSISGESGVRGIVQGMLAFEGTMPVVGVLDGDQRGAVEGDRFVEFLPGDTSPERLLRRALDEWRRQGGTGDSPLVGADPVRLRVVLERISGIDAHDWLEELAAEFGGKQAVTRGLVAFLLRETVVAHQAGELVGGLARRVRDV
ncbi:MAG: ATP-binding protein, partial [Actinobacteria bacterium]|nr:ATP-binding protein [Actinomycetota bacterium]